jgi:multidrug transporter EmrE-like cation transporter
MAYLYLAIAIIAEVIGTLVMMATESFTPDRPFVALDLRAK